MNLYSFLTLSVFYLSLPMSLFVLFQDLRSRVHRLFCFMSLALGTWNLLSTFAFGAEEYGTMMLWFRIGASVGIVCFPLVMHFSLALTRRKTPWWMLVLVYAPSVLFEYRNWTGFFMFDSITRAGSQWFFHAAYDSPWLYAWLINTNGMVIVSLVLLFLYMRQAASLREQRQVRVILISLGLLLLAAVVNDLVFAPLLRIPAISPVYDIIFIAGSFYAIVRYRFLSVTRRTVSGDIVEALQTPVVLADPNGAVLTINRAAETALGVSAADAAGKGIVAISGGGKLMEDDLRRLRQGSAEVLGCTLRPDAGCSLPPVEARLSMVRDEFGEPLGILLTGQVLKGAGRFLERHGITERTVKSHLANVFGKLGVRNRMGLARVLRDNDLFDAAVPVPGA